MEQYIEKYKGLTEAIIVNLKNGLTGEEILDKRAEVLKLLLENDNFNKEDIKKAYINSGAENLDEILKLQLENAREEVRVEMKKLEIRKNANSAYGKSMNIINSLNKKI